MKNKTCLFCLKQRQILVDNPNTANAIKNIYSISLPKDRCRFCVECHFYILRVREFKRTIQAAADYDVDSCFVCKSENTVNEPGVDRVVSYLIKQCTTIDFGNTDIVKACVTCMHILESCIKYEKLARNYAQAKQFCKQYSSLKECNVALQKIDLNALGGICEGFDDGGGKSPQLKKTRKRERSSVGEEAPSKKTKQEDGSVLPVMLTKLTPTGGKKSSPPNVFKAKSMKQSDKIFIKLPLFSKTKKKLQQRKKHVSPHLPIRSIPASPSVEDLNRIFNVELRPLSVRIEHIDLSSYLNKTISDDTINQQLRKPRNEEFIGLDEEDVVELQNTSLNISISKRKSILITERTESPNSAKKKVKFSDSPSIKYVDKLEFCDEENSPNAKDGDNDQDQDATKNDKKTHKQPNGTSPATSENGKSRARGRSKKLTGEENGKDADEHVHSSETEIVPEESKISKKTDENMSKVVEEVETAETGEIENDKEVNNDEKETEQASRNETIESPKDKEESKSDAVPVENGETEEQKTESPVQPVIDEIQSAQAPNAAPMEAEDLDDTEPMKVDQNEDTDDEMKAIDSPEDVEMTESKSPPTEDIEMKEIEGMAVKPTESNAEATSSLASPIVDEEQNNRSPTLDGCPILNQKNTGVFETSDKEEEEEMEKFKLKLCSFLGEEISDSDPDASQHSHGDKKSTSTTGKHNEEPDMVENAIPTAKDEQLINSLNTEAQITPTVESEEVPDTESPNKISLPFSSLDDVDEISDDDDILNQLDEPIGLGKRSPDLPPLGEDSL